MPAAQVQVEIIHIPGSGTLGEGRLEPHCLPVTLIKAANLSLAAEAALL